MRSSTSTLPAGTLKHVPSTKTIINYAICMGLITVLHIMASHSFSIDGYLQEITKLL